MEVSLLACEGLPKGCLLSVRAGSTRRQAPADLDKFRLAFPKVPQAGEPFKVDVLANLGGGATPIQPGVECYDVPLGQHRGQPMRATLLLRQAASAVAATGHSQQLPMPAPGHMDLVLDRAEPPGTSSRRHRAALSARRYLDGHNLLQWAESLFQDLIREQPEDPWEYIDKQTQQARRPKSKEAGQGLEGPEASAPSVMQGTALSRAEQQPEDCSREGKLEAQCTLPSQDVSLVGVEQDMESPGGQIRKAQHGADNEMCAEPSINEKTPSAGASQVSLPDPVKESQTEAWAAPCKAVAVQAGADSPDDLRCTHKAHRDALRSQARDALVRAARDCSLAAALRSLSLASYETDQGPPCALAEDNLVKASSSGSTAAAPQHIDPVAGIQDELRAKAREALLHAAHDGSLASSVQHDAAATLDADVTDVASLRIHAKNTLLGASRDGSLAAVLGHSSSANSHTDTEDVHFKSRRSKSAPMVTFAPSNDQATSPKGPDTSRKQMRKAIKKARTALVLALAPQDPRGGPPRRARTALVLALAPQDVQSTTRSPVSEDTEMSPQEMKRAKKKACAALLGSRGKPAARTTWAGPADKLRHGTQVEASPAEEEWPSAIHSPASQDTDLSPKEFRRARRKARTALLQAFGPLGAVQEEAAAGGALLAERLAAEERDVESELDMDQVRQKATMALEAAFLPASDVKVEGPQHKVCEAHARSSSEKPGLREVEEAEVAATEAPSSSLKDLQDKATNALKAALLDQQAVDDDALKHRAAAALEAALLAPPEPEMAALRQKATNALRRALLDQPEQEIDSLKQRAAEALKATLLDPSESDLDVLKKGADKAIEVAPLPDEDDLKARAAEALAASLLDEPGSDLDSLKQRAAEALEKALNDQGDPNCLALKQSTEEAETDVDVDDVKQRAGEALKAALLDQSDSDMDSLKQRAMAALEIALLEQSVDDNSDSRQRAAPACKDTLCAEPEPNLEGTRDLCSHPTLDESHSGCTSPEHDASNLVMTSLEDEPAPKADASGSLAEKDAPCIIEAPREQDSSAPLQAAQPQDPGTSDMRTPTTPAEARRGPDAEIREVMIQELEELRNHTQTAKSSLYGLDREVRQELSGVKDAVTDAHADLALLRGLALELREEMAHLSELQKAEQERLAEDTESEPSEAATGAMQTPDVGQADGPLLSACQDCEEAAHRAQEDVSSQARAQVGREEDLHQTENDAEKDANDVTVEGTTQMQQELSMHEHRQTKDQDTAARAIEAVPKTVSPRLGEIDLFKGSLKELEARICERNEKYRRENDAMRLENTRLRKLRHCSSEAGALAAAQGALRADLSGRLSAGGRRRSGSAVRL